MQQLVENQKLVRKLRMVDSWKRDVKQDPNPFQKSPTNENFLTTAYKSFLSSVIVQIGLVSLLVLLCIIIYRWRQDARLGPEHRRKSARLGPRHWPIIGSMPVISRNYHQVNDWLLRFFLRTSTICVPMPLGCMYYCTVDPANVKHLLDVNYINYQKGKGIFKRIEALLGQKQLHDSCLMRRWTASEFSKPSTCDMGAHAFTKSTCSVAKVLSEAAFKTMKVDVQELLRRASLDAAGDVALGIDFASVPNSLWSKWPEDHIAFSTALDSATDIIIKRFSDPLWELKRFFNIGQEAELPKKIQVVDDFIYRIIAERKHDLDQLCPQAQAHGVTSEGTPSNARQNDFISKYLSFTTKDEIPVHAEKDVILRHIVVNFVVASRDATATTLTWFVYMMSQKATVAHKLYEELREFHARKRSPRDSPLQQEWDEELDKETYSNIMTTRIRDYANLLTCESLNELPYLQACVQETIRLYPVVPLDPLDIEADDILPDGYTLKGRKGNMIFIAPYVMARLTSIWGPDAATFNPQRWLHDGKLVPGSEFKFVALQVGLYTSSLRDLIYRNCKVGAAILGRFFEFIYAQPLSQQPVYRTTSTLLVENGLQVHPRLRD